MVPFDPSEAVAAGMPSRLHVKVGSFDEALWPTTPCRIDYGEAVAVLVVVDIDQMAARGGRRGGRGIAKGWGNGLGWPTGEGLPIEAAGLLLGKVRMAAVDGEVAAAVADEGAH